MAARASPARGPTPGRTMGATVRPRPGPAFGAAPDPRLSATRARTAARGGSRGALAARGPGPRRAKPAKAPGGHVEPGRGEAKNRGEVTSRPETVSGGETVGGGQSS